MTATLPYTWYTDAEVLRREREHLFAHRWQYAGHTGQLTEPGSYFTLRVADIPLVVVRDREGELHCHVNVCRHRGAEVVSGAGPCSTLQCHYHAWTYNLDGSLRAAPRSEGDPASTPHSSACERRRWTPGARSSSSTPTRTRARSPTRSASCRRSWPAAGLDVDELRFHRRRPYSLEANWKVAVENYLECYHCAVAHPSFSDVIDVSQNGYKLQSNATFASHLVRPRENQRNGHYDTSGGVEGQFHMIWPSMKVNIMPGRPNLSIGPLVPVEPERTDGYLDYFFSADTDAAWIEDYQKLDDQVGAEDRVLVESVQRGMRSQAFEHGRLLLPSEELIGDFQRWVAESIRGLTPPGPR